MRTHWRAHGMNNSSEPWGPKPQRGLPHLRRRMFRLPTALNVQLGQALPGPPYCDSRRGRSTSAVPVCAPIRREIADWRRCMGPNRGCSYHSRSAMEGHPRRRPAPEIDFSSSFRTFGCPRYRNSPDNRQTQAARRCSELDPLPLCTDPGSHDNGYRQGLHSEFLPQPTH